MPKISLLRSALEEIDKADKSNAEDIAKLVFTITDNLFSLTATNFEVVAPLLIPYGLLLEGLYKKLRDIPEVQVAYATYYAQLITIGKLSPNRDINSLEAIWSQMYALLIVDKGFETNLTQGSYAYYFMRNKINAAIADEQISHLALLEWLIPQHLDYIEKRNRTVVIKTMINSKNIEKLEAILTHYHDDKPLMQFAMTEALRTTNVPAALCLIKQKVPLPEDFNIARLIYKAALVSGNKELINVLESNYSSVDIQKSAISHGDVLIANRLLDRGVEFENDSDQLKEIVTIAAACGEEDFLKSLFQQLNEETQKTLYESAIKPNFIRITGNDVKRPTAGRAKIDFGIKEQQYGRNQARYRMRFKQVVSKISYQIEKNQFTFKLAKESDEGLFGLVACGELRREIAHETMVELDHAKRGYPHQFGTIRNSWSETACYFRYQEYFTQSLRTLEKLGTLNKNTEFAPLGIKVKEFQVRAVINGKSIPLTCYRQDASAPDTVLWRHTNKCYFERITDHLDTCYRQLMAGEGALTIAGKLQRLAYMHYFLAHLNIFFRGTAAVSEAIIGAFFQRYGLEYPYHTEKLADCTALAVIDVNQFVKLYPTIFGCKTYEEMAEKLRKPKSAVAHETSIEFLELTGHKIHVGDFGK